MRWLVIAMLAVVFAVLQTTVVPRIEFLGARPDLPLALVVAIALHGRAPDAMLAAWFMGMLCDFTTLERPGLFSLSYVAAAGVTMFVREYVFRQQAFAQAATTLLVSLLVRGLWTAYPLLVYGRSAGDAGVLLGFWLGGSLYTALLAPPVNRLALRFSATLGLTRPRYSYSSMRRSGGVVV